MNPTLYLFDLDGTLVDTAPEIALSVNAALAAEGLPPVTEADVRHWIGRGARETLASALLALDALPADDAAASRMLERLHARFERAHEAHCATASRPFPGVRETLQALGRAGHPMAVITNKATRFAARVLDAHRLAQHIALVLGSDALPRRKPDPLPVEHACAHFGVAREATVLVGDSATDVATARNAGIRCLAVSYGYNRGRPVAEAAPDDVIDSLTALLPVAAVT